jgi:ribosome-associated protein
MAQDDAALAEIEAALDDPDPHVGEVAALTLIQIHRFRALRLSDLDASHASVRRLAKVKQRAVVEALEDIKGKDIVVYNTARMPSMFERVVIATGDSNRQVKALADNVQERIKSLGSRVYGVEGEKGGEWVLVDLGDVVVHIMHPTVREFYNLEEIWGAKPVRMRTEAKTPKKKARARAKAPRRRAKR